MQPLKYCCEKLDYTHGLEMFATQLFSKMHKIMFFKTSNDCGVTRFFSFLLIDFSNLKMAMTNVSNIALLFWSQGLEPSCKSLHNGPASYFTPIRSEGREKVDILELLHKAKVDLKPLLSTLSVNKARLQESSECHFKKISVK